MKRFRLFPSLLLVGMMNISLSAGAQTSGDEQGFSIPSGTELPEDREALIEAAEGWWKTARENYDERMSWYNDA